MKCSRTRACRWGGWKTRSGSGPEEERTGRCSNKQIVTLFTSNGTEPTYRGGASTRAANRALQPRIRRAFYGMESARGSSAAESSSGFPPGSICGSSLLNDEFDFKPSAETNLCLHAQMFSCMCLILDTVHVRGGGGGVGVFVCKHWVSQWPLLCSRCGANIWFYIRKRYKSANAAYMELVFGVAAAESHP